MHSRATEQQLPFIETHADTIASLPWRFSRQDDRVNAPVDAFIPANMHLTSWQAGLPHKLYDLGLLEINHRNSSYTLPDFRTSGSSLAALVEDYYQRCVDDKKEKLLALPWALPGLGNFDREWSAPLLLFPAIPKYAQRSDVMQADTFYQGGILDKFVVPNVVSENAYTCNDPRLAQEILTSVRERKKISFAQAVTDKTGNTGPNQLPGR